VHRNNKLLAKNVVSDQIYLPVAPLIEHLKVRISTYRPLAIEQDMGALLFRLALYPAADRLRTLRDTKKAQSDPVRRAQMGKSLSVYRESGSRTTAPPSPQIPGA
jgi:hypothetical protein